MEDVTCTDPELRTLNERCRTYQGTAKISISQITVLPSVSQHISEKNVKRLCGIFEKEGCRRLDSDNYISAVVSTQHLHDALQVAGATAADLLSNQPSHFPHLHFPTGSIKCLHGQHRLKAGEQFLPSIDQWWTVDLYLDGKTDLSHSVPCKSPFNSPKASVRISKPALLTNIATKEFQAMAKFTSKSVNIEIKQMSTSRVDGCRGCQITKQGGFAD